ncbi:MAG TPA: S8 family serine peptidase [Kofleriaceae bacterium]|nr:S8 family serine peptidase [Kofleriaceae bacterium]
MPATAQAQIEALLAEKAARSPAQRKIASTLLYEAHGTFAANIGTAKDPSKRIEPLASHDKAGRVLVDIAGDVTADRVAAVGGAVVGSSALHHAMRAWLDPSRLEELAGDASVSAIRPAFAAKTQRATGRKGTTQLEVGNDAARIAAMQEAQRKWLAAPHSDLLTPGANGGSVTSAGVIAHGADLARKQYAADGTGVTVGVLSDSDDGKEAAIASGDLPADTITVPGQDGRPGAGEGTAMMEIVHDMAPGAKLAFATAFNGPDSMADNIRALRFTYHADVIVDDVIYYEENPYQDDVIAAAVDDVVADGAVYVSSAGNEGNYDDGTSGTWEGDFKSAGTLATLPSGYTVHSFGDKVISDRIEVAGGPLVLQWSDPSSLDAPMSFNDYDLFVLDQDLRNVLVASTDLQDGAGLPAEYLGYNIPAGLRVVIAKHPNADARAVRATIYNGELGLSTEGATFGHNSANGALGAAAVNVAEAGGGAFTSGPTTPVELYSSDGPRRVFYDRNGNAFNEGAVTFASGGGQKRNKPDIAGADGVATTLPSYTGLNPFFGTSAAAPHVGAIAALVKSVVPGATSLQIRNALTSSALDIEAAGRDRDAGAGLAWAPGALKKAGAPAAVYLEENSLTLSTDAILPGSSASFRLQLINNGLAKATAVSATLSTSTPGVTITTATSSYPNIAAGATATDPTAYAFTVAPTVPCGTKLDFTLAVNYTGVGAHPTTIAFSLQVGRPGTTLTNVFTYAGPPVAIPDGDPTGVDIPVTLTGTGPISRLVFSIDGTACSADAGSTTVGLDHTWIGDVSLVLSSPAGTAVSLLDAAGGPNNSGNNLCQTVLDDAAASSIEAVTATQAPFTGTYRPNSPLAAFAGQAASGTWNLHAADSTFIDSGNVRAFSIYAAGFTCE